MILTDNFESSLLTLADFPANAVIGTAAGTLDLSAVIQIPQTTANITLTLPSPTNLTSSRLQGIFNTGTVSVTLYGAIIVAGSFGLFAWNGTVWCPVISYIVASNTRRSFRSLAVSGPTTVNDDIVECTGGIAVTLPNPTTTPIGKEITVKRIPGGAGNITMSVVGGSQLENANNNNAASFNITNNSVTFATNGTNWRAVNV